MSNSPAIPPARLSDPRPVRAWPLALAALLAVLAWALLSPPAANDLTGGDEGYYGVMARNLLASRAQWAAPSLSPLGPPGDKPPLYPALIAATIRVLGPTVTAVRLPSLVSAFAILLAAALIAGRLAGRRAAWVTLALLACLPWLADASRVAAAEIPLTAFGLLGLLAWTGEDAPARRGIFAGLLFGAAFLCKLWLAGLLVIPALLALGGRGWARRLLASGLGFALMVGLHLFLLLAVAPHQLKYWANVVWGLSLVSRARGEGYAGYWFHPPGWYAAGLLQAFVLVTPLLARGAWCAWRDRAHAPRRMLLGAFAGLILLSVFRIKAGGYLYPLVPLFGVLAAVGFESLRAGEASPAWLECVFAALASPPALRALGGTPADWKPWVATWTVYAVVRAALHARPRQARRAAAVFLAFALVGGAARVVARLPQRYHDTGYREVSAALGPWLAEVPRDSLAMLVPEAPTFAFHTFRRALYWDTPYVRWTPARFAALGAGTPRAFVVDPSRTLYGGWPDSTTLRWLAANTHELTDSLFAAGARPKTLRVFVRR